MDNVYVTGIGIKCNIANNYPEYIKTIFNENVFNKNNTSKKEFVKHDKSIKEYVGAINDVDLNCGEQKSLQLLEAVTKEALNDAKIISDARKAVFILGTSIGGEATNSIVQKDLKDKKFNDILDNSLIDKRTLYYLAEKITKKYQFISNYYVISTACSASANAVTFGAELINNGEYDIAICAGVDELADISIAGFSSLGAINQERFCQPFTKSHGISLGEGAGAIILEKNHKKGAYAKVLAGTITSDSYHMTAPEPTGVKAYNAIKEALSQANISADKIDYINAHGTGTKANDSMELNLLSTHFPNSYVSSTKSFTGHTLGAAGIIEIINCIASINKNICVGTRVDKDLEESTRKRLPTKFLINELKNTKVDIALNLSFAFGGNNSAVLISDPDISVNSFSNVLDTPKDLYVKGADSTFLFKEDIAQINSNRYKRVHKSFSSFDKYQYLPLKRMLNVNPRKYMRLDDFSKMAVEAVYNTLHNNSINLKEYPSSKIGIIFSTPTGPANTVNEVENMIPKFGYEKISAMKFPFTVMNAATGAIALTFNINGPSSVIMSPYTGFSDAIKYASLTSHYQDLDLIIVVAAAEFDEASMLDNSSSSLDIADGCNVLLLSPNSKKTKIKVDTLYSNKKTKSEKEIESLIKKIIKENILSSDKKVNLSFAIPRDDEFFTKIIDNISSTDWLNSNINMKINIKSTFTTRGCGEEFMSLLNRNLNSSEVGFGLEFGLDGTIGIIKVRKD